MKKRLNYRKILRPMGTIALCLLVLLGPLLYLSLGKIEKVEAAWYDDAYAYRHKLTFTHNADISSNRSVTVTLDTAELIAGNVMQSDCDDTRFTDGNGKALLYDLTGTCNNASTTYEVIFPSVVNGSNLFYVYYGNAAAANGEISSTGYTALTPSGGDPSETDPTTDGSQEQGPGPVSHWSFDEGQGATANDYSTGSNNDLTITNAAWKVGDLCLAGNCLYFDGNADRASKSYSSDTELLPGTGSFTVMAWFKHISTAGADTMLSRVDAVAGIGWKVYMDSSGFICFGIDAVAGSFPNDSACSTTSYADSRWHHVAAVKSTTASITIFIDGNQVAQDASITGTTLDGTSAAFRVGNDFDDGTNGWNGFIDEVKYYNYAKTTGQIQTENAGRGEVKTVSAKLGASTSYSLASGLIGYWKTDESAANSCTGGANDSCDFSGNGNDGAWNGNATNAVGKFGNAVTLDGTGDYIQIGDSTSLDSITDQFSVSIWVKPNRDYGAEASDWYYYSERDGTASYFYQLGYNGWSDTTSFSIVNSSGTFYTADESANNYLTSGIWYHFVGVFDKNQVLLYKNGALVGSSTFSGSLTTGSTLRIGGTDANRFFNGTFDEQRIYNRALSPAEVSALYAFAPSPAGWWKMDENTGTSLTDSSGYDNTGSFEGTAPVYAPGKFGSAGKFNGTDNYGYITDLNNAIDGVGAMTIETWIYPPTLTDWLAIGRKGYTDNDRWELSLGGSGYGGSDDIWFRMENGSTGDNGAYSTDNSVSAAAWTHVAVVYDGTQASNSDRIKIYTNGILRTTTTVGTIPTTTDANADFLEIAKVPGSLWSGSLDDFRIYNYARTPKQVVEDMNAGHPAGGSPISSAVGHWKFDDCYFAAGVYVIAQDSTGNDNDLTLSATGRTYSGKYSCAWSGAGTNWLSRADDADFDFAAAEDFTVTGWFNHAAASAAEVIVQKFESAVADGGYQLRMESDGNIRFGIDDDDTSFPEDSVTSTLGTYDDSSWHHFAAVKTGTTSMRLYIDGKEVGTADTSISSTGTLVNNDILYIGDSDGTNNGDEFIGSLDEIKIYRSALTASEVLIDYNTSSAAAFGDPDDHDEEGFSLPNPTAWWKLDENTSQYAADSSGNDLSGFLGANTTADSQDPIWASGKFGSALTFDGSNDAVAMQDLATLDVGASDSITLSAWVRRTGNAAFGNPMQIIDKQSSGHTAAGYWFRLACVAGGNCDTSQNGGTTLGFGILDGTDEYVLTSSTQVTADSQWHHVVAVWDNSSETNTLLYIDGKVDTVTRTGTFANIGDATSNQSFCIGHDAGTTVCSTNTQQTFNGQIDNVQVYKSALTATQIAYLYNRGAPIAWYKFDECQGSVAYDSALTANGTAAGKNGTITIGAGGSEATIGDCTTSSTSWFNGVTGKYSSSIDLDGTDDYAEVADNANLDFSDTDDLIISGWFNRDTFTTDDVIVAKRNGIVNTDQGYILYIDDATDKLTFEVSDATDEYQLESASTFTSTGWNHFTIVWDQDSAANSEIYINGLDDNAADTGTIGNIGDLTNAIVLRMGSESDGANYFDGKLDNLQLYRYAVAESDLGIIRRMYTENSGQRFGPASGSP